MARLRINFENGNINERFSGQRAYKWFGLINCHVRLLLLASQNKLALKYSSKQKIAKHTSLEL